MALGTLPPVHFGPWPGRGRIWKLVTAWKGVVEPSFWARVIDEAVEAGTKFVVVDLGPGRGRVAAGRADPFGQDAVGPGVFGEVEGGADEAAVAEGAVDRPLQLDRVDAVGDAVEAEADVALAEPRFAAEVPWGELEVAGS